MNVTIIQPPADQAYRSCMSAADCRYRTFDGVAFDYCSTCTMTLLSSAPLTILSATECEPADRCRCTKIVTIIMPGVNERIVYFNGTLTLYAHNTGVILDSVNVFALTEVTSVGGVDTELVADSVYLRLQAYNVRLRVDADGMLFIMVDVGHTQLGPLSGMCGNFDLDPTDEIKYIHSSSEAKFFGDTQKSEPCGLPLTECLTEEDEIEAQEACKAIESRVFSQCHALDVDEAFYVRYCMRTYCTAKFRSLEDAEEAVCSSIALYASECARNNVVIQWRSESLCRRER
nr:hypothetical protein BaRGS_005726 [Batillaria attramentaria]